MSKTTDTLTPSGFFDRLYWDVGRERRTRGDRVRARRRRPARAPRLEFLEERIVPSGYSVINMGLLGGTAGVVFDINSHGAVVGGSTTANNGPAHAFLFSHGKMSDLGTLGGADSQSTGINDAGEVVGASMTSPNSQQSDLFLYRDGHMTDLGALDFTKLFGDIKINNHGDVIGLALSDGDASLLRHGRKIDLGELAGLGSAARALNDNDEVVGYSPITETGSTLVDNAFLYNHGKMTDLGTLGGSDSLANDINDRGTIVGLSSTASGANHAFLFSHGHMTDLGTLGGGQSVAGAINDSAEVVGTSLTSAGVSHAFLDKHGKMIDLNSLIPATSGFVIDDAEAINDRGQIVGEASSTNPQDQTQYVVLLNPQTHGP
jgi:probable HAF family extracellular repeat protein